MFADEIQVARKHAANASAVVVRPRLKCVVRAQQTESGGAGENFCVGSRRETGGRILLIVNDRAVLILDNNGPAIAGDGRSGKIGINLVRNGLAMGQHRKENRRGDPETCADVSHAIVRKYDKLDRKESFWSVQLGRAQIEQLTVPCCT